MSKWKTSLVNMLNVDRADERGRERIRDKGAGGGLYSLDASSELECSSEVFSY